MADLTEETVLCGLLAVGLANELEAAFRCELGLIGRLSQTGEPYVVIRPCGVEIEGEVCADPLHGTPEEAAAKLKDQIFLYARNRKGILYWRDPIEIGRVKKGPAGFSARARLLISDKPAIAAHG